jgi:hypothetical protein
MQTNRLILSLTFLFVFYHTILIAQAPDTLWTTTYGAGRHLKGNWIQQTYDEGYIIVGSTDSIGEWHRPSGNSDVFLLKTNAVGDTLWTKTYGDSLKNTGRFVKQTSDDGYIIIGETESYNIWLIKTDPGGDTLWTKNYDSAWEISSICQTDDSGYIIVGHPEGTEFYEILMIKTDQNGDVSWTKTYGDNYDIYGRSVKQTSDGGYIIIGDKWNGIWLLKTDSKGDTLWTKTYTGGYANSIRQTIDGGYIILGSIGSWSDVWLIKTDTNGDTLWTKKYHDNFGDYGVSVEQTNDGGYIILANSGVVFWDLVPWMSSDMWLIKTDAYGDTLWSKTFGDNLVDICTSLQKTIDGGFIILGNSNHIFSGNPHPVWYIGDIWLIKLAPELTIIEEYPSYPVFNFQLNQNYPNPFNPSTKISYQLHQDSDIILKVYDITGREIKTLVNTKQSAGKYSVSFDASNLASGIYFYRLKASTFEQSRKMMLLH